MSLDDLDTEYARLSKTTLLFTSAEVRDAIVHALQGQSYAEVARRLAMSDETLRTAVSGDRELAKTILDAFGFERVTLYRRKKETAPSAEH